MAKDVEQAVCDVAKAHGGLDATAASALVGRLKSEGRYLTDVY